MRFLVIFCLLLAIITTVVGEHLIMGDTNSNRQLIHHTMAQYHAIPMMKRVKNVFYNNQEQRIIGSIMAYDNLNSKASATVTAGGIGFSYVNIRLKSERGKGLDYDIGIYS
ncbi:hypothetical protein O3G_MSEX001755 [Manduca sexta]|uniref:Uncharacterized protein n=1 Tax=Manduca sexta TaxID=7130 RepID=A0A922CBQ9_MANSE|nr:hypothetical protein O3G_MSEX001755 [Manduca sexta]